MIRWLGRVAAWIFLLSALLALWLAVYRQEPAPVSFTLPEALRPGVEWPTQLGATCAWYAYYYISQANCYWQDFYFSYDLKDRVIQRTALVLPERELTVGQLILVWGQPTGYHRSASLVTVHWPDRYVYVAGQTFNPANWVSVVVWVRSTQSEPWRGFRQMP